MNRKHFDQYTKDDEMYNLENPPHLSPDEFTIICRTIAVLFESVDDSSTVDDWKSISVLRDIESSWTYLSITRDASINQSNPPSSNSSVCAVAVSSDGDEEAGLDELEDDLDVEALESLPLRKAILHDIDQSDSTDHIRQYRLIYDIVLSPTYRVPVLYLQAYLKTKYNNYKPTLMVTDLAELLGVVGTDEPPPGLSLIGHPVASNRPGKSLLAWMVHPCMTADALSELLESVDISYGVDAKDYNNDLSQVAGTGDIRRIRCLTRYFALWIGLMGKCLGLDLPLSLASAIDRL